MRKGEGGEDRIMEGGRTIVSMRSRLVQGKNGEKFDVIGREVWRIEISEQERTLRLSVSNSREGWLGLRECALEER
jgi:hypothetical protein